MPLTSRQNITQRKASPAVSEGEGEPVRLELGGLDLGLTSNAVLLLDDRLQTNAGGCAIVVLWQSMHGQQYLGWREKPSP